MRAWTIAALAEVDFRVAAQERGRKLLEEARREFERCGDPWGLERCEALSGLRRKFPPDRLKES
jgi:hypothetical protein